MDVEEEDPIVDVDEPEIAVEPEDEDEEDEESEDKEDELDEDDEQVRCFRLRYTLTLGTECRIGC